MINLSSQAAVMQNQVRAFRINRDVAIERRNNVNNVERVTVTLPKKMLSLLVKKAKMRAVDLNLEQCFGDFIN